MVLSLPLCSLAPAPTDSHFLLISLVHLACRPLTTSITTRNPLLALLGLLAHLLMLLSWDDDGV
jgi:hypothetical protein